MLKALCSLRSVVLVNGAFHFVGSNPAHPNHWIPDLRFSVVRIGRLCSNTLLSSALGSVLALRTRHELGVCWGSLAVAQPHGLHGPSLHVFQFAGCLNLPIARVGTDTSPPFSTLPILNLDAAINRECRGSTAALWFT